MDANEIKLWIALGLISSGGVLISWLINRNVNQMDKTIEDLEDRVSRNRDEISTLKVDVARAHSGQEALTEHVRLLRHDVKEMKNGIDGYFQRIMELMGRGK